MSSYEELRLKNIADNKKILAELGILNPFKPLPRVIKKSLKRKGDPTYVPESKKTKTAVIRKRSSSPSETGWKDYGSESVLGRRRSSRIKGLEAPEIQEIQDDLELSRTEADEEDKKRRQSLADRPMFYGAVPGVEVGTWWAMRIHCNHANIHRPTVAGIHSGPEGAYSIALSGGYEDDIDMGDCFTYTGEGGRDLKGTANKPKNLRTAPQSRDQWLSRGNASLVRSVETKNPVRVIRGFKSDSVFAPEEGYRYDGLYQVEKYWYTTGMAGFGVYKFALRRIDKQAPPPWHLVDVENNNTEETCKDKNRVALVTAVSSAVKLSSSPTDSQEPAPSSQDSGIEAGSQDEGQEITGQEESESDVQAVNPDVKGQIMESESEMKDNKSESGSEVKDQAESKSEVKGQAESKSEVKDSEPSSESVSEVKGQQESELKIQENEQNAAIIGSEKKEEISVEDEVEGHDRVSEADREDPGDDSDSGRDTATPDSGVSLQE